MTLADLEKTKYENIYTFTTKAEKIHYYVNFTLNGTRYQKKNLTKLFGVTSVAQARSKLEEIKTLIRRGENPFFKDISNQTIKKIIINQIDSKKSSVKGKDNSAYKESLTIFFNKYIDPIIGHLHFGNVKKTHIDKIMKNISHLSNARQKLIKVILYQEFEDRFRRREITDNPLYGIKFGKTERKVLLDIRLNEDIELVAKKLYKNIMKSQYKAKMALLISIMCVRRSGEALRLKYKDVHKDKKGNVFILTTKLITKTGIDEKYSLPQEVVDMLPEDIFDVSMKDETLCKFHKNTIFLNYNKMMESSNILLNNGYKLTSHDNRNIFISLMVKKDFDYITVDSCLSHSNDNRYLEIGYEKRSEIFQEYWKILRSRV